MSSSADSDAASGQNLPDGCGQPGEELPEESDLKASEQAEPCCSEGRDRLNHKSPVERELSWANPLDWLALVMIVLVRLYQLFLSPFLGQQCRFEPTCSRYFIEAVRKYGAISGAVRGAWRICRCHPWHPGGYDPP